MNSLYPTAQVQFEYAYGQWHYLNNVEEKQQQYLDRLNFLTDVPFIQRSMFKIDCMCPKDLITAFLMERTKDGELVQSLRDKVGQWYWGNELIEAVILGYKITKIYEIKWFPHYGPLFEKYVKTCWEGRKNNPKPSIKNTAYKNMLVSLTGKFAQKSNHTSSEIYNCSYIPTRRTEQTFQQKLSRVVDYSPIFSKNGDYCALMLELDNDCKDPNYPVDKSAQILANSRVIMSRVLRTINGYLDPQHSFYYTDTDSLLLHARSLGALRQANLLGKDMGQLSCDINDRFNGTNFAKILRGIWSATKGPYSVVYLEEGQHHLLESVKAKGIPHIKEPFRHDEELKLELSVQQLARFNYIRDWVEDPYKYVAPIDLVTQRFYMLRTKEKAFFMKHINFKLIKELMKHDDENEVFCFYGGMKKAIQDTQTGLFFINMYCTIFFLTHFNRIFFKIII